MSWYGFLDENQGPSHLRGHGPWFVCEVVGPNLVLRVNSHMRLMPAIIAF